MTPKQSAAMPTVEDLDRRWPGFNAHLVEELLDDYRWEKEQLSGAGIGTLYEQVDTLVRHDMMEAETVEEMEL